MTPKVGRLRFEEAVGDVLTDYLVNGTRSYVVAKRRIERHLTPFFGGRRMASTTTTDVRKYIAQRQATPIRLKPLERGGASRERQVSNGESNRELTLLKRAFSLAIQAGKLLTKPYIPLLKEQNTRTGFFEREQFEEMCRHLPAALQPMVQFAYVTGWRIPSEVLTLQWRQVDLVAGEVTLDPGTTKNDEARVFPLTQELRRLLLQQ